MVKSVPSPSIFSASLPNVKPMLAGMFTSAPAVKFMSPVPAVSNVMSALDPFDAMSFVVTEVAVTLSLTVNAPVNVVAPVTASVVLNAPDVPVSAPVTATVEVAVTAPSTFIAPFTWKPSAIVINEESSALKVVPAILTADATTPPVPFGNNMISSFDLADVILRPLTSRSPPSCGVESSIRSLASAVEPYRSVKLSLILSNAVLNGSPVPSFAADPMLIVCCAMFKILVDTII